MAMQAPAVLSKSRFLAGLQCRKRLWTEVHAPDLVPPVDAATRALFDQGHEIGRLATELFPGGLEVGPRTRQWDALITATQRALSQRRPLYEAAFRSGGAACRVDILVPADGGRWDVCEVKSSTRVKDVHLQDVALQACVVEGSGIEVRDYFLIHIDTSYVRRGALEPEKLFRISRITEEVKSRQSAVPAELAALRRLLEEPERPRIDIGPHCSEPYECPLKSDCWAFLPPASVFDLIGARRRAFELLESGILELTDIPAHESLTGKQQIQLTAIRGGRPHVDRPALFAFLRALDYPVRFFDIETFASAMPLFDGSRPYQPTPFLFSVHRLDAADQTARHFSYLASEKGDPRGDFLRAARAALGGEGSIVSYNAAFERRVLRETAEAVPELADWAATTGDRMLDLLTPFRSFAYYHPAQLGSVSLKAVLPALTGMSYSDLEIADGEAASREYLRVSQGEVEPIERLRVLRQLEQYCALDTLGMVEIVAKLRALV